MAGDVFVSFGADTGELEAAMAKANAEVRALARELSSMAGEMRKTGADADSELGQKLNATAEALAGAKGHVRDLKDELKGVGEVASEAGGGLETHMAQVREILLGLTRPLAAVRNNLGELAEAFAAAFAVEKAVEFVKGMGELGEKTERTSRMIGLSSEEVGRLNFQFAMSGTHIEDLGRVMGRFEVGLAQAQKGTGPVAEGLQALGLSAQELINLPLPQQLEKIAEAVNGFADGPTKTAALQSLGRGFIELLPLLDQGAGAMRDLARQADATGTVLDEAMTQRLVEMQHGMVDLGASIEGDGIAAFAPFIDVVDGAVAVLRDLSQSFLDSAKSGGDVAQVLHAVAEAIRIVETGVVILIQTFKDMAAIAAGALNSINDYFHGLAATAHAFFTDLGKGDLTFSGLAKASADANAKVRDDFAVTTESILANGEKLGEEFRKIWQGFSDGASSGGVPAAAGGSGEGGGKRSVPAMDTSPIGAARREVEDLTRAIEATQDALTGKKGISYGLSGGDRDRVIRTVYGEAADQGPEGQQAVADVIRNRAASGRYGATIDDVTNPQQFSAWGDSRTLPGMQALTPDSPAYKSIGEQVDKVFSGAVADITKGASNYYAPAGMPGGAPPPWAAKTEADNEVTIGGHRFSGKTEGLPEAASGEAPTGEDRDKLLEKEKELNAERDKARTKVFDLEQAERGGSETDKAKLAIAEDEAKQTQNAVSVAQREADAKQKDVDAAKAAGIEQSKINALVEQHAALETKVREAKSAQEESGLRLGVAQAKATGDAQATFDAEMKLVEAKRAAAGADPTKQNQAMQEQVAAQTAYENALRERVAATSRAEIDAAKETSQAERLQLDERLKTHQISDSQWLSGTKAALEQERAAVQAAYDQEIAAAQANSTKKIEIKSQEQKALAQISQQEAQAADKAAETTEKQYEGMVGGILSSFTSAFKGMISGHETFRQAMLKAIESLADKFIDMVEKMVVKWIAGELAQTAATTTGTAARTAAESAGTAAGGLASIGAILKSISASAGQAFAGVFGFLAPVMGPAAAGPAAGAEATVLSVGGGLASADIGMWQVPNDMTAMIHRNELIMPAAQAGAFRDLLSGGGSSAGGGRTVNVNPSLNLNVRALDSSGFQSFMRSNQREMMKGIHNAVRSGAHLGLRATV